MGEEFTAGMPRERVPGKYLSNKYTATLALPCLHSEQLCQSQPLLSSAMIEDHMASGAA